MKKKYKATAALAVSIAGAAGTTLNEAHISATAEVVIRMINGEVDRFYDDATGLNLFEF